MSNLSVWLYLLVIGGVVTVQCLITLWVVTSSRPFFFRALVGWAAIVPLIPIKAYGPALFFAMTTIVAQCIAWIVQWLTRHPSAKRTLRTAWHFHLSDILVAILLIATIMALGQYLRLPSLASLFLPLVALPLTFPLAPPLVFARFAVSGPSRGKMAVATAVFMLLSAAMLLAVQPEELLPVAIRPVSNWSPLPRHEIALQVFVIACLAACVATAAWIGRELAVNSLSKQRRFYLLVGLSVTTVIGLAIVYRFFDLLPTFIDADIGKKLALIILHAVPTLAVVTLAAAATWLSRTIRWRRSIQIIVLSPAVLIAAPYAWLYWQMLHPLPFPPPPTSHTNNYERIISIGRQLADAERVRTDFKVPGPLYPVVDELVVLLRAPNFIPTSALEAEISRIPPGLRGPDVYPLMGFLYIAALEAVERREFDRGADYALAGVRFVSMFYRGGTITNAGALSGLSGLLNWLADYAALLSEAKAREVIAVLYRCLAERESLEVLKARDQVYWRRFGDWQNRVGAVLGVQSTEESMRPHFMDECWMFELYVRSVQVRLAASLFSDRHKRLPNNLAELVPEYLPGIPIDVYSGKPLAYQRLEDSYILYSVGRDRIDNGGRFDPQGHRFEVGYDISLTTLTSP
jgi:hypothetical protein